MNPVIARARTRLVVALAALAVLAPAALAAAQYPRYWEWIALELTPMTWLQTVLLLLAAATSAVIAVIGKVHGWSRALRIPHWLLAAGFAYLALDDRFAIHERIRDRILAPRDISIPGLSFLAPGDFQVLLMGIAGLIVLPFVLRALRRDRLALWLFVLGVVCSVTSVCSPPITPARAIGPRSSVIRSVSGASSRSTPSRVRSVSPGRATRTPTSPCSVSRSNAWSGCPSSSMT